MKSSNKFLVALIAFSIPCSLFANFITDVSHQRFKRVAVERNVITFFDHNRHDEAATPRDRLLNRATETIVLGQPDHDLINHHGHGVDGIYEPHTHLTFGNFNVIHPSLLNQVLIDFEFSDEERIRIMQTYAQHFARLPTNILGERPLRATPRPAVVVPSTSPVLPPVVPTTPAHQIGLTRSEETLRNIALAFFVFLAMQNPSASTF